MNQNVNNKKVSFTVEISMTEAFKLRALVASTDNLHHPPLIAKRKSQLLFVPLIMFCQLLKLYRAKFYVHVTVHRNKFLCNKTK